MAKKLVYKGATVSVICPRGIILVNEKTSQKNLRYILSRGIKLDGVIEEVEKEVEVIELATKEITEEGE